jgi:hypothetical protein
MSRQKKHRRGRGDEKRGEEKEGGTALSVVCHQDFCAGFSGEKCGEFSGKKYGIHPAAVLLVMAWSGLKEIPRDERAGLLLDLETLSPAEQVRHWHGACVQAGLKPWRIICLPASRSGQDCTMCAHLVTRYDAIGDGRKQYHSACGLGYLILETGRGTERIWIAPPECKSYESWYPSRYR